MSEHICQRPIHPGEILKEEVEYRNIKQTKLAEQMGISYKILNDINVNITKIRWSIMLHNL